MHDIDNQILLLEKKMEEIDNKMKKYPTIKGYYYSDIIYYEKAESMGYFSFEENLFGEKPLDYKTHNVYKKYRLMYAYKTTAIRHTAKDLNIKEKEVKKLLKKYQCKIKSNNIYMAKLFINNNKEEVENFKRKYHIIDKHNKYLLEKWHNLKKKKCNLIEEKEVNNIKEGADVIVKINFKEIKECESNLNIDGSLRFFANNVPRPVSKKDVLVAKKQNKIKIRIGNLEKAINNIYN